MVIKWWYKTVAVCVKKKKKYGFYIDIFHLDKYL